MPKEIIFSAGTAGDGGYHVKVGWTADQTAQVGVETDGGTSLFWALTGCLHSDTDEGRSERRLGFLGTELAKALTPIVMSDDSTPEQFARAVLNTLDCFVAGSANCSSVWSDLDRGACNRLVRAVRKARDSAYGRDE